MIGLELRTCSCPYCYAEGEHSPKTFSHSALVVGEKHDLTVVLACHTWKCEKCGTTWNDTPEIDGGQLEFRNLDGRDFTIAAIHKSSDEDI